LQNQFAQAAEEKQITDLWYAFLKEYRASLDQITDAENAVSLYQQMLSQQKEQESENQAAGFYTREETHRREKLLALLGENAPKNTGTIPEVFASAKEGFDGQREKMEAAKRGAAHSLEHAFDFVEQAFEAGEEMLVFVTELTLQPESALFLATYTCDRYLMYNERLLVGTRRAELLSELNR
jgi:hypothetical protein